jgi:hypothetical protein
MNRGTGSFRCLHAGSFFLFFYCILCRKEGRKEGKEGRKGRKEGRKEGRRKSPSSFIAQHR